MTRTRITSLAVAGLATLTCLVGLPGTAEAASGQAFLKPGEKLFPGQYLILGSGMKAIMQRDTNFVLYDHRGRACDATHTTGKGDSRSYVIMQTDGNLVLYKYNHGPALWSSGTHGSDFAGGHAELIQGDPEENY